MGPILAGNCVCVTWIKDFLATVCFYVVVFCFEKGAALPDRTSARCAKVTNALLFGRLFPFFCCEGSFRGGGFKGVFVYKNLLDLNAHVMCRIPCAHMVIFSWKPFAKKIVTALPWLVRCRPNEPPGSGPKRRKDWEIKSHSDDVKLEKEAFYTRRSQGLTNRGEHVTLLVQKRAGSALDCSRREVGAAMFSVGRYLWNPFRRIVPTSMLQKCSFVLSR